MTTLHYVKKSRKAIYQQGKVVKYPGTKGSKREGTMVTKLDRTKPANSKDRIFIPKGSPYYWWQFKNGPIIYALAKPRRSQLTRSEFLSQLYDLEDEIDGYTVSDVKNFEASELETQRDEWVAALEQLRDECQDKLDNMPDGLRDSSDSGMLLQERVDGLDTWISELENTDINIEDNDVYQETARGEWSEMTPAHISDAGYKKKEWIEDRWLELKEEAINDVLSSLQGCNPGLG